MIRLLVPLLVFIAIAPGAPAAEQVGCSWPLKFDTDTLNAAFPDRNATYWLTRFEAIPATRLVLRGTYPQARYISFHAYDEAQHPVDSLADVDLDPDPGSGNPFRAAGASGTYTAFIEFTPKPATPARNTLYAGQTTDGSPNPSGFVIYRVYVADDAGDPAGSEPLPDVSLQTPGGEVAFARCEPQPPSTGGAINEALKTATYPDDAPRSVPFPPAQFPPKFLRFYSTEDAVLDRFPPNPVFPLVPRSPGGFLSNQHIAYLYVNLSRQYGDVFVFRAKAPAAPDTRSGDDVTQPSDARYWSLCQNEFVTQRFVDCVADFETPRDADGWFTTVVSDVADRPANATAANGVSWLPWGGAYYDALVIYRHMLPATTFGQAIQRVPKGVDPATVMGGYYPRGAYCSTTAFEAGGWQACLS